MCVFPSPRTRLERASRLVFPVYLYSRSTNGGRTHDPGYIKQLVGLRRARGLDHAVRSTFCHEHLGSIERDAETRVGRD
ncbi:predicted protein [Ostreococcus lucimarinus CCE9901]|uniref:Uncharacterized protein n=1 Tax=Ostreococcus lucimarinus (strain CCE9901) TaxID=436017 RepID=A4RUZ7_OSTLU|nr:predicted protein [Ostreococcus lucimarinus CCE9901]ABO95343.1 predicted protein [Ostreococcus lucimarinus CCE9901]|eukprot:XP_001417050.1 predicted protein [Ostreococcus lucimarinus CCE9901]